MRDCITGYGTGHDFKPFDSASVRFFCSKCALVIYPAKHYEPNDLSQAREDGQREGYAKAIRILREIKADDHATTLEVMRDHKPGSTPHA